MSLDHEARISQLENVIERQAQTITHILRHLEKLDINLHTAGKMSTPSPVAPPPAPPAEVTNDARTFDEWSASGYSIIKGQKSTMLADGRRIFYSSQVRIFVSRAYAAPAEPVPAEAVDAEDVPPDFFTPRD